MMYHQFGHTQVIQAVTEIYPQTLEGHRSNL